MRLLDKVRLRLRSLFRRQDLETELDAELRYHLDELTEEYLAAGMPPAAARQSARQKMGTLIQCKEECRDMRRVNIIDNLVQDLRYTLRSLAKNPGFTAVVVATLALGIGANTAIFTIVHGVLLRPLDYPNPGQLTYLTAESPATGGTRDALSAPEYDEFRRMNQSFSAVGAYAAGGSVYSTGEANLTTGDGSPVRVRSLAVDSHLLRALALPPEQGRLFNDEETSRWSGTLPPPVALLSSELWHSAFGGRPVLEQQILIEGRPHRIVGIMPPGADLMDNHTQVWLPLWLHPAMAQQREAHVLYVIARRKPGISLATSQAELNTFLENWGDRAGTKAHVPTSHPVRTVDHTLQLRTLQDAVVGDSTRTIWVLQIAVGFVLLIVCANLANLVVARAGTRSLEFVLRTALGAGRARLLQQTITEGAVLSAAGGLLGLWLAAGGLEILVRAYPATLPRTSNLAIDWTVFLVALALSAATALLFGFVALGRGASASSLISGLKEGTRGSSVSLRHYARRALVVVQVAFAVILVTGAGLLAQTVYNLSRFDAGFDRSRLVTFSITLPMASSDPDTRAQAFQRVLANLGAVPGILGTAAMSGLPPARTPDAVPTPIEHYTAADGRPLETIDYYQFVLGDYFATMGIPIVAGQGFATGTSTTQAKTVVVNETFAKRVWKGENPIGRRIRPPGGTFGAYEDTWHTVIGVARDVRQQGIDRPAGAELYLSLDQHGIAPPSMNVVVRTTLPPASLAGAVRGVVHHVDGNVPVARLREMDAVFAESIRRPTLLAQLLGAFAVLALLLAAIGTYGVLSYMVTERRREIGIRVALGASRTQVLTQILKQGLEVAALGLAAGLAGAFAVNRLLASLLFGVQPADATTLAAVVATITAVAAIASWLPAWRASRLDPNVVLRE